MTSRLPQSKSRPAPVCVAEGHCVTCADEGVPMRVSEIGPDGLAVCVDETGNGTDVMTALVGEVAEGDTLLVHAGTALARILETGGTRQRRTSRQG